MIHQVATKLGKTVIVVAVARADKPKPKPPPLANRRSVMHRLARFF